MINITEHTIYSVRVELTAESHQLHRYSVGARSTPTLPALPRSNLRQAPVEPRSLLVNPGVPGCSPHSTPVQPRSNLRRDPVKPRLNLGRISVEPRSNLHRDPVKPRLNLGRSPVEAQSKPGRSGGSMRQIRHVTADKAQSRLN